jgi:hypothetical protein
MKKLIFVLTLAGILTNVYSQSTLLWSENFTTGLSNYYSECPTIEIDSDTIQVIGRKNTTNGQRLLIVKYDLNGDTISTKIFGNDSVFNNTLIDFKFDSTDNVYLLQREKLGFYKSKIVLQKYSLDGNLIWAEQIQNPADTSYTPFSLGLLNDTCLFITLYKEYDYPKPGDDVINTTTLSNLFAYNSNGNLLWKREFNPTTEISWFAYGIFVYNNNAFLFANNASYINCLIKLDLYNNLTINTSTGIQNGINDVQLTKDNNLLITAWTKYRISKTNLNGTVLWTKYYDTNLPSNVSGDEIKSTIQDTNGNIYVTGRHYGDEYGTSNYTNADILTLKYKSDGNLIWQNRYEFEINNADIGNFITIKNGYVYVGGESQSLGIGTDYDFVVLKIDSATGVSKGVYRYNGDEKGNDAISSLKVFDNGKVALTGLSYNNINYDWTTQFLSDVVLSVQTFDISDNIEIYPNPILREGVLTIKGGNFKAYSLVSSIGQVVQSGILSNSTSQVIKLDNINAGMFLFYLKSDKEVIIRKIVVK